MKKIFEAIKKNDTLQVALGVAIVVAIAIPVFLGRGGTVISGWQVLMNQSAGEWFRMILFSLLAGVVIFFWIRYHRKTQDGRNYRAFLWSAVIFISIAFGKACTDKANEGVTSANGRPKPATTIPYEDRVPAKDLLPKK